MTLRERVVRALYPDDYLWLDEIVRLSFTPAKVSYCSKHLEQADAAIQETLKWAEKKAVQGPDTEEDKIAVRMAFVAALKREAGLETGGGE